MVPGDVKGRSVLLDRGEAAGGVKLADFGAARVSSVAVALQWWGWGRQFFFINIPAFLGKENVHIRLTIQEHTGRIQRQLCHKNITKDPEVKKNYNQVPRSLRSRCYSRTPPPAAAVEEHAEQPHELKELHRLPALR